MSNQNSAMGPVQATIYTVLTGDSTLKGLVGTNIFDEVPPNYSDFPYVELGDVTETPDNTFSETGRMVEQVIHVYSQAKGWLESQNILEQLVHLIDETLLPNPTGWTTYMSLYTFGQEIREPDGVRHIVSRFTIKVSRPGH